MNDSDSAASAKGATRFNGSLYVEVDRPLGPLYGLHRLCGQLAGHLHRPLHELVARHGVVGEAELDADPGGDPVSGEEVLLGLEQAHQQRPEGGAAVAAHQADAHVGVGHERVVGDVDDVTARGDAAAEPHGRSVHRADQRFGELCHRVQQPLGAPERGSPVLGILVVADEARDVAAGAERAAGPVSTTLRTDGSCARWIQTSRMATCMSSRKAFFMSGLVRVRTMTGPSCSIRRCSVGAKGIGIVSMGLDGFVECGAPGVRDQERGGRELRWTTPGKLDGSVE